jgi:hypothetical protein
MNTKLNTKVKQLIRECPFKLKQVTDCDILEMNGDLEVLDWGFDYEFITVPRTHKELIRLKTKLQLRLPELNEVEKIALNWYFELLKTNNLQYI